MYFCECPFPWRGWVRSEVDRSLQRSVWAWFCVWFGDKIRRNVSIICAKQSERQFGRESTSTKCSIRLRVWGLLWFGRNSHVERTNSCRCVERYIEVRARRVEQEKKLYKHFYIFIRTTNNSQKCPAVIFNWQDNVLFFSCSIKKTTQKTNSRLGFLDTTTDQPDLKKGTKLELPLWLAKNLYSMYTVDIQVPRAFSRFYVNIMRADSSCIDLKRLQPNYYKVS